MSHDLVNLGAARVDAKTKALLVQCKGAPVDDDGTAPDYGEAPMMCALGVVAKPWPADAKGSAEGLVARDVPGMDGAIVGARDPRTADILRKLDDGDTGLVATGPERASQILAKEDHQIVILTTDKDTGKDVAIVLDGKKYHQLQISAYGCLLQMSKKDGTLMTSETGGAYLQLKGSTAILGGASVVLGGRTVTGIVAQLPNPTSPTPVASPGVFCGK